MTGVVSALAVELRREFGGSAVQWQQAIGACGSPDRARWLIDHAWPDDRSARRWTPGVLVLASAFAGLLDPDAVSAPA